MERICDFSTSSFAKLVKTTSFLDNTLMIREIFSESSMIEITAPRQFGKSTNLNMVKQFLEIVVDHKGSPKLLNITDNYRLFKDNNLDICSDEEFFNEHFGKHPVVFIDFEPLANVRDFIDMLDTFRTIVNKTMNEHGFIFNMGIYKINTMYYSSTNSTYPLELLHGYEYLSKILFGHFGKEVFVLIDNCDAFVNSMLFKSNTPDSQKMISFIKVTMDNLLKGNPCVGQAVLTGVLPVTGDGFPFCGNNIECYYFLDGHRFCKYYALTSDKLDKVLEKLVTDDEDRNKVKTTVSEYYGGYRIKNQTFQVYCIRSVLQYLCRKEVKSYLCNQQYVKNLKPAFEISEIRDKVERLLSCDEIQLDTSLTLSTADILEVNKLIVSNKIEVVSPSAVRTFLLLLYHFGYLSINKVLDWGFVSLKIPNVEIKRELEKMLGIDQLFLYDDKQVLGKKDILNSGPVHEFINILDIFMKVVEERTILIRWLEIFGYHMFLHYDSQIVHPSDMHDPTSLHEFVNILEKCMKYLEERNALIRIVENHIRNIEENADSEAFSIESILKCFQGRKLLNGPEQIENLKAFLVMEPDLFEKLVMFNDVELQWNKSQSITVILQDIREIITSKQIKSLDTNVVYVLLHYLGCLVITRENKNFMYSTVTNDEIKYDLANALLVANQTLYCYSHESSDNIRRAVDMITLNFLDFYKFGDAVCQWYKTYKNYLTEQNLLTSLFMILVKKTHCYPTVVQVFDCGEFILVTNKHRVSMYIMTQGPFHQFESADEFTKFAQECHKRVMTYKDNLFNKNNNGNGTVVFVISYGSYSCQGEDNNEYAIRVNCTSQFKNNERLYSHRIIKFDGL